MSDVITYEALEEAYKKCASGPGEKGPSYGIMALSVARYILKDPYFGGELPDDTLIELFYQ